MGAHWVDLYVAGWFSQDVLDVPHVPSVPSLVRRKTGAHVLTRDRAVSLLPPTTFRLLLFRHIKLIFTVLKIPTAGAHAG